MKKVVLILGFLFVSVGVFGQQNEKENIRRNELRGPAYKNYKPWKHDVSPTIVYTDNRKKGLTGPAYKNYKPWKDTTEIKRTKVQFGNERQKLRGPAYKNYKPWKKKKSQK